MRVVLTGGGTGGHLFPLVAVAKKIKEKLGPEAEFLFIGPKGMMEQKVMSEAGIPVRYVLAGKMRRYFAWQNFLDMFKTPVGFFQALWVLLWYMPEAVFSKGGYASVPVVLAAWVFRIPVLMHESDATPGVSNQMMARFVKRIAVSYQNALVYFPKDKTALIGNPVRDELTEGDLVHAQKKFGLTPGKPIILVLGGSQGSRIVNRKLLAILPRLLPLAQVVHQTGEANYDDLMAMAKDFGIPEGSGYYPQKFFDSGTLGDLYAAADLIISRAGASTISEIAAAGKPCILIPLLSSANNHQRMNAYEISKIGGGLVIEENNLGENFFFQKIEELLRNEEQRRTMAERIQSFYHPEAAEKLARGIIELIKH